MSSLLKYGISVLALTVGVATAHAQDEKRLPQGQGQEMQRPDAGGAQQQEPKAERQKRGEAEQKREPMQGKAEDTNRKERMGQGEERKDQKTGQAEERKDLDRNGKAGQANDHKDAQRTENRRDDSKPGDQMQNDRRTGQNAEPSGGKKPKNVVRNVRITSEKKTVIRDRIFNHAPKRYTRNEISFNLSIGTSVPRNIVVYDVPPTFVDIVPEFQGYDYIIVGDVLLIIDPDTREIVDVVDVA